MTATQVFLTGMIIVLWAPVLFFFRLRNWRAAGLAGLATLLILAAFWLPWPLRGLSQAAIWGIVLAIFFMRTEWVGVISAAEYEFIEDYSKGLGEIVRLKARVRTTDAAEYLAQFQQIVRAIEGLKPPREWRRVHAASVQELRRRGTRMALLAMPSEEEQRALDLEWTEVEIDIDQLLRDRAGFWQGWPRLSREGRT